MQLSVVSYMEFSGIIQSRSFEILKDPFFFVACNFSAFLVSLSSTRNSSGNLVSIPHGIQKFRQYLFWELEGI